MLTIDIFRYRLPGWVGLIWKNYSMKIYKMCLQKSVTRDDADDLFQEVALRFCQSARLLNDDVSLFPWLQTVLFHCSCNHYRNKDVMRMIPFSDLHEPVADYDSGSKQDYVVEDKADGSDRFMKGFFRLMEELEPIEQKILEMSLVKEVNIRDISKILRMSKGSIIRIRNCAMEKLREKLSARRESFKVMTGRNATLREIIEYAG